MTITCTSCHARYRIADERAHGPFKVRCRRCGEPIVSAGAAEPEVTAAGPELTAARHEQSVLFSIANLRALAARPTAARDSGLLDLRALSKTTGALPGGADPDAELPLLAPLPLLLQPRPAERRRWLLPAALVAVGVLLASTVALAAALLAGTSGETRAVARSAAPTAPEPTRTLPSAALSRRTQPTGLSRVEPRPAEPRPAEPPAPTARARRAALSLRPNALPKRERQPADAPAPAKKPAAPSDPIAKLVETAIARDQRPTTSARAAARPTPPESALPETLSKAELQEGMRKVQPLVQACHDRHRVAGLAAVRVSIAASGQVRSATVKGPLAGTPTAACIERAVRSAVFARFREGTLTIPEYPFLLR